MVASGKYFPVVAAACDGMAVLPAHADGGGPKPEGLGGGRDTRRSSRAAQILNSPLALQASGGRARSWFGLAGAPAAFLRRGATFVSRQARTVGSLAVLARA